MIRDFCIRKVQDKDSFITEKTKIFTANLPSNHGKRKIYPCRYFLDIMFVFLLIDGLMTG